MNNKVSVTNSNNPTISLSAVIYFPPKFDETRQYPAIVVSHPGGGVKEQTAGTYAEKLAEKGFVTIAYDASYQGESGGEPRQLENPYIRTEDVSAVIDYLTTLSYVDNTRIGAMGICAGAGYTANAAIQDRRIKAKTVMASTSLRAVPRSGASGGKGCGAAPPLRFVPLSIATAYHAQMARIQRGSSSISRAFNALPTRIPYFLPVFPTRFERTPGVGLASI